MSTLRDFRSVPPATEHCQGAPSFSAFFAGKGGKAVSRFSCRINRALARCAALGILFVLLSSAAIAMPRAARHESRHEIEQLEERWCRAMVDADLNALGNLLADDYIGITANGTLQTRDELLDRLRSGSIHFKAIEVGDRKIRFYGPTALVTSRAEVSGSGASGDLSGSYRYTHVYARTPSGSWQIVSFEASRIRDDDRH